MRGNVSWRWEFGPEISFVDTSWKQTEGWAIGQENLQTEMQIAGELLGWHTAGTQSRNCTSKVRVWLLLWQRFRPDLESIIDEREAIGCKVIGAILILSRGLSVAPESLLWRLPARLLISRGLLFESWKSPTLSDSKVTGKLEVFTSVAIEMQERVIP